LYLAIVRVHGDEEVQPRGTDRTRVNNLLETTARLDRRSQPLGYILTPGESFSQGGEITVRENQSVAEMANEVLMRQAKARAERRGEPIEEAMEAVLDTEAGQQLMELRDGPHGEEGGEETQVDAARERAKERAEELGRRLGEPPGHPAHG
jgi:hypothetical protein